MFVSCFVWHLIGLCIGFDMCFVLCVRVVSVCVWLFDMCVLYVFLYGG